jgi:hypothetical protein
MGRPQEEEEEEAGDEDTRRRTSRKWSSSQGSATGPGAAGNPYSSSAFCSSSRNAGWLRCASGTTNRLVEPEPEPDPAASTHTATCPAGTTAAGHGHEGKEEKQEADAAVVWLPPDRRRRRRTARRSHARDGIVVIASLHMLLGAAKWIERARHGNGLGDVVVRAADWIEAGAGTGGWPYI